MSTYFTTIPSPIGELMLIGDGQALQAVHLPGLHGRRREWIEAEEPFAATAAQFERYFAGERTEFDLPLAPRSPGGFVESVWEQIAQIPYGETNSYGSIARAIGRPDRARAVGSATGRNPLAIIVPCHRVIGSDGSLAGYAGGLPAKRTLLELESGARQETLI